MKSAQDIYNTTLFHLRNQGKASMGIYKELGSTKTAGSAKPRCAYRGEGGTSCAVGCHIPDVLYKPKFEGLPASYLPILRDLDLQGHSSLIMQLQALHDADLLVRGIAGWESGMKQLASSLGLVYTPSQ